MCVEGYGSDTGGYNVKAPARTVDGDKLCALRSTCTALRHIFVSSAPHPCVSGSGAQPSRYRAAVTGSPAYSVGSGMALVVPATACGSPGQRMS